MYKLKLVALGISAMVAGYGVGILALGVVEAQQPPPHASSTADSGGGGQWVGSGATPAQEWQGGETVTLINASYHSNSGSNNATHAKVWGVVGYDRTTLATAKDVTRVSGQIHNPTGSVIKWRVKLSIEHKCKAEVLPDPDPPPGDTQAGYYHSVGKATSEVIFSNHEQVDSEDPISQAHKITEGAKEWKAELSSNKTASVQIPRAAGTNGPDDPGDDGIFKFENSDDPPDPNDPYYELALTDNTQFARLHYWVEAYGQVEAKRPEIKNGVEAEASVPEGGYMQAWDYSDPDNPVMMKKSDGTTNASWAVK